MVMLMRYIQTADLSYWMLQFYSLLTARASEQGNVIGLVSVYIYIYIYVIKKKL